MSPRGYARRGAAAALLSTALVAVGCGQVSIGEESGSGDASTASSQAAAPDAEPTPGGSGGTGDTGDTAPPAPTTATAPEPAPTPGPGAPAGCTDLLPPLHRLVTGEGDRAATAEEVRRLADETADNALSAVARRLSGLSAQPDSDPAARDAEWDQVRQICRVG